MKTGNKTAKNKLFAKMETIERLKVETDHIEGRATMQIKRTNALGSILTPEAVRTLLKKNAQKRISQQDIITHLNPGSCYVKSYTNSPFLKNYSPSN